MINWAPLPAGETLTLSASQFKTHELCARKWWLSKVVKVEEQDRGYFTFGTVLHAVLERYLRADDRGVDPGTGQPVELYPTDWHLAEDSGIAVSLAEQDLIRHLVQEAIAQGVIVRTPGRLIEHKFTLPLIEGVAVTGFVDVMCPDGIADHKSIGNWRYALTPAQLQKDRQLLIYAYALLAQLTHQPSRVFVRHNQFGKKPDDKKVRSVEAWITPYDAFEEWRRCGEEATAMLKERAIKDWNYVPGPKPGSGACQKYNGCDFLKLCSGQLSLDQVDAENKRLNEARRSASLSSNGLKDPTMNSVLDVMMKAASGNPPVTAPSPQMNSGLDASAPASAPASSPAPVAAAAPVAAPAQQATAPAAEPAPQQRAPWYHPNCAACTKNPVQGFSSRGAPCRICDYQNSQVGLPTSQAWDIRPGSTPGTFEWSAKGEPAAPTTAVATPGAAPTVEVAQAPAPAPPAPAASPAPAPAGGAMAAAMAGPAAAVPAAPAPPAAPVAAPVASAPEDSTAATSADVKATRGRGRPPKGFSLLIGCRPTRGINAPIYLTEVLAACRKTLSEDKRNGGTAEAPVEFYALDPWKRTDAIRAMVPELVKQFGTEVVVADCMDSLEGKALIEGLRSHPCQVIEGVA